MFKMSKKNMINLIKILINIMVQKRNKKYEPYGRAGKEGTVNLTF